MGQGDQKPKYTPSHHTSYCAVTRLPFNDISVRPCPHEEVQRKYGAGCKVSVYVCAKCRYGERDDLCGAWKCSLSENKVGGSN